MTATEARPTEQTDVKVDEKQARQVAEAARESDWHKPSFGKELFLGRLRMDLVEPWPTPDPEKTANATEFLAALKTYAHTIDGAQIERDAKIPDEVFQRLAELGAFGMKIDKKYGGLGLSNLHYCKALTHGRLGQRIARRAAVRAPVDRRTAAAQTLRHRRAEAEVPAPTRRR